MPVDFIGYNDNRRSIIMIANSYFFFLICFLIQNLDFFFSLILLIESCWPSWNKILFYLYFKLYLNKFQFIRNCFYSGWIFFFSSQWITWYFVYFSFMIIGAYFYNVFTEPVLMNNGSRDTSTYDIQKLQQQLQDIKEQVLLQFLFLFTFL